MDFLKLMIDGGFIMVPLLICSIIVWAMAIEKYIFLRNFKKQMEKLSLQAHELIAEKKFHEAKGLGYSVNNILSAPYIAIFEQAPNREAWEDRISRRLIESQNNLKKSLWIVGTIGSAAPFIGLFGTVCGIIKSFDSIAVSGKSGFAVVASGLSEALIATASGIIVAIVAVFIYNYFLNRLSLVNTEFKHCLEDIIDLF